MDTSPSILPDRLLPPARLEALSRSEGLAVVEIAGRDSVAAAIAAVRERGYDTLLPTVAFAGTETGDPSAPLRAVAALRTVVAAAAEVLQPLDLGSRALWSAMNARYASEVQRLFGVCSPCLACHTYMHLTRVPLAWRLGHAPVVSGERETHGGRVKLSQTPGAIDAAVDVLAHAGVELLEPVRGISDSDGIASLVGEGWDERAPQLGCVLSGNYIGLDGRVSYSEEGYARYLDAFLRPVGVAVVDAWRTLGWERRDGEPIDGNEPDYDAIVRGVLEALQ